MQTGKVVSMRINVGKRAPMLEVEDANFITYEGIEGDRHRKAPSQMKYSSTASVSSIPKRQILLMDMLMTHHTSDLLILKQVFGCQKDTKEHMAQMDFI